MARPEHLRRAGRWCSSTRSRPRRSQSSAAPSSRASASTRGANSGPKTRSEEHRGLRRDFMNCRGNRKYTERFALRKGKSGASADTIKPKRHDWKTNEDRNPDRREERAPRGRCKTCISLLTASQLLPTARELEIGREFPGGNEEISDYQRTKVRNAPLPEAAAEKHLGFKYNRTTSMPWSLALGAGRTR